MARTSGTLQTTLRAPVSLTGIGVHSGLPVSVTLHPADANTGITFLRTELAHGGEVEIAADWRSVAATELCTVIGDPARATVATIEHLMAALRGLMIDNVIVEIDGAETPVMDGSSAAFIDAIDQVGIVTQSARRRYIKVLKPVRVEAGAGWAELRPHDGTRFEVTIEFPNELIGKQTFAAEMTPSVFRKELSRARTFGFVKDLEKLIPLGLCRGSSLENSVAIRDDRVLNPEGLRYADEFVRHKALDAVGDIALSGAPILGLFRSYRGGHRLNFQTLQALFADETAWTLVDGASARRESASNAEVGTGMVAPAFGPDRAA